MITKTKRTVADYPNLVAEWHPTKNGDLKPCDVTAGSDKKVWWKCCKGIWPDGTLAEDHEWQASIKHRTSSSGCPCCSGQKVVHSNCLATTHPEIAAQWHPTKNGNLKPCDVTAGSHKKAWWKCYKGTYPDGTLAEDHEWEAAIYDRKKGNGCPCCSGQKVVHSNCLATTHPDLAAEWHLIKNGNLKPCDVTAGSYKKVWWKCCKGKRPDGTLAEDHEWRATIKHRKNGRGCPKCNASKGEKAILDYLNRHNIPHTHQWGWKPNGVPIPGLPRKFKFDFAVNRNGALWLIEYNGEQHYMPVTFGSSKPPDEMLEDVRKCDLVKERYCQDQQKKLLVIPYWDLDDIEKILSDFFAGQEPLFSEPPEIAKNG